MQLAMSLMALIILKKLKEICLIFLLFEETFEARMTLLGYHLNLFMHFIDWTSLDLIRQLSSTNLTYTYLDLA